MLLVAVAKANQPRLISNSSIPGLLSSLQSEWDDLMLETFQLKQALDQSRQELAQALYQHDAACRVIARLMRERDEAYAQLQQVALLPESMPAAAAMASDPSSAAMEVDHPANQEEPSTAAAVLPDMILAEMNDKCKELSTARKSRKLSPSLTAKESLSAVTTSTTLTPYPKSAKLGTITCLALSSDSMQSRILIGGGEKEALMLDRVSGKQLQKLSAHAKQINELCFHPDPSIDTCFTASSDRSVKLWTSVEGKLEVAASFDHPDEVSSMAAHPTGHYLLSGGFDGSWKLWNLASSSLVRSIAYDQDRRSALSVVSCIVDL